MVELSGETSGDRRPEPPRTLTQDLHQLLDRADGGPLTIERVMRTLRGRGMALVIIVLAAPFVPPVPLPGLSTPLGLLIGFFGLRLAFGLRPWLPAYVMQRRVEHQTLVTFVRTTERVVRPLERILKPRRTVLFARGLRRTAGFGIAIAAAILLLPLPFPGANAIPALGIVLLAAGLMERDAAFVIAGHLVVAGAFAYLYLWWDLVVRVLARLLT